MPAMTNHTDRLVPSALEDAASIYADWSGHFGRYGDEHTLGILIRAAHSLADDLVADFATVMFEPGDMTRYYVAVARLDPADERRLGARHLISLPIAGRCTPLTLDGHVHPTYLEEKLQCGPAAALLYAGLLSFTGTLIGGM